MMDTSTQKKWNFSAVFYDLLAWGAEQRWGPRKREFFSSMHGKVLFVAVGTGQDIPFFPPGRDIIGIDISPRMLAKARERAARYPGLLELRVMDIHALEFPDHSFDQVVTSCTLCSVPDPVAALIALRRVLKPGGELYMFEHTGSRVFPFNRMLDVMTPIWKPIGPEMNRDTVANVEKAGFKMQQVSNVYLDVVKTIIASAPEG
ncbi:MAG: class I SAM-dependent methyltransferase [Gammaproteobacteria bacterium]|jgi:ubiquinone/menaquinone biosynthesis C-methylase UbiE|nr:class I SAM-dependent methyltransferase [Gammaproteobacteria bacterium]